MAESKPATPRPATAARFCLAGILFVIVAFAVEGLWSPDLWWQLATGRWIVDHGQIPSTDPFSFTAADNEWIELRWLFCLAIYGVWQLGGPTLLIAGKTIFLMLTFGVLVWAAPRTSKTLLGALLMALAVVASLGRFAVRPELITYLFLATFIVSTERLASDRCRRGLWFMPLAQIVWTNAHTLFILGPVVCWAYWLGSLLRPSASQSPVADTEACAPPTSQPSVRRRLLITATLVTAACFINPYVYRGAFFPFKLFLETQQTHFLTQHIDELRTLTSVPIATWSWNIWAVVILFAASALTFLKESKSWHPGRLILWLALAYLAVTSIRNLALFAIVATAVSLHNVEERLRTLGTASDQSMAPRADRFAATGQWALALFLIAFAWLGASNRFAQDQSDNRRAGLGVVEQNIPCQAVDFLLEANVAPEIYSSMADGNYLIWASNGKYRAFVDGRLEVYGDEFLQKYFTQTDDFDAIVTKHGINAVLLQRENFAWLVARLAADPKWALVHLDARNLVYLRDVSANSDLIARHRLDPQKPFTPRGDEPDESPPGLANWIGGVGRPWYSVGMARTFLTFGAVENAETYLQRALDHYPDDVDARSLMAAVKIIRGRPTEAERLLTGIDLSPSQMADHYFILSELLRFQGRNAEAVAALTRAAEADPADVTILTRLAETCILANDIPKAIESFRAALKQSPTNPQLWMRLGICLESRGDQEAAIRAYRESVRHNPALYTVQNQLGILLARQGDAAGARKCFEEALRVNPEYESARNNLQNFAAPAANQP